MNHKIEKLENPLRVQDLAPNSTLLKLGLTQGATVCDIGAGSGIFTIPASQITKNTVYAIDVNKELLEEIDKKAAAEKIHNIRTLLVQDFTYPIEEKSVDFVLLVTVFHEIDEKEALLTSIKRILTEKGKLCIIEFRKEVTPMGPEIDHRIAKEEVQIHLLYSGYHQEEEFELGANFYCLTFGV